VLPPSETTVRVRSYNRIDSKFSLALSIAYWRQTGNSPSVPSHAARGFGEVDAAGRVKNQYVRAYLRSNGAFVPGHWRYGNADGRATCRLTRCGSGQSESQPRFGPKPRPLEPRHRRA
jgi:hypothetical protein